MDKSVTSFPDLLEPLQAEINWKVVLRDNTRTIYRQIKNTYFEELSTEACKMEVRKRYTFATPSTIGSLTTALMEDHERLFDDGLFLQSRCHAIGFQNGVFDLKAGTMRSYRPTDFICDPLPHKIPLNVDRDAEKWLVEIFKSWTGVEVADWMLTLLGYMLFIFPNRENLWLNFFGSGSNGKSVCLELLEAILGDKKCIGCDLKNLNRFSGEAVEGKWLVIGRDSSSIVSDGATSFIKTFSGDDKILVERKGGSSYDTPNQGKIIVSTNALIQSKDRSFAWYRRLFPIHFPNEFPRNVKFKESVFKRLPEIIRILLDRAYKYQHNETSLFASIPEPVQALRKETRMMNDKLTGFWEEHFHMLVDETTGKIEINPNAMIALNGLTMTEVYEVYKGWHAYEFGETNVEPGLKSFGGAYGAFLSTDAGKYFEYKRTNEGRKVFLRPQYLQQWEASVSCSPTNVF